MPTIASNSTSEIRGHGPRRAIASTSAATRLQRAVDFLARLQNTRVSDLIDVLVVSASRGAADDIARTLAFERGATAGLHRFSLAQLAARIAAAPLAARGTGPSSTLATDAVAARAAFETMKDGALEYFEPVASFPGFPRALASTLRDIRAAALTADRISGVARVGPDLAAVLERFEAQFASAASADRAELFRVASEQVRQAAWTGRPLLLLDVPCDSPAEQGFVSALWVAAPAALATIPAGDEPALRTFKELVAIEQVDEEADARTDLAHLRRHLFRDTQPQPREVAGDVKWFSAPGEGRECTEIARFILAEARGGVRFDEMAILLRAPQRYHGLLEHALARAGVPAWFDRGTRRPHPAGRAFLALLACANEGLSASRFAEYLSMGQVPKLETGQPRLFAPSSPRRSLAPADEMLDAMISRARQDEEVSDRAAAADIVDEDDSETSESAVIAGTLRAPWKWERLLVESAVIGGAERWRRRLEGLDREYRFNAAELHSKDPDDPRLSRIERDVGNLRRLREFALPLIDALASWPETGLWGDWLDRLDAFAPSVLRRPDEVLRVLADLRPMSEIGPVSLEEVSRVLTDRLLAITADSPRNRYGRVFVGSPHQARGRLFRVVFVPGLAERMFPQRLAEDPLLIDELRQPLGAGLPVEADRAVTERLLLRLSAGSAADRLYVSYPRIDSAEARERVPSFYALEIMRAITGNLPGPDELRRLAATATDASLAWPAPKNPEWAVDDLEHDLSVLAPLLRETDPAAVHGRARYLIRLSDTLRRSVTSRWERGRPQWAPSDGIVRVTASTKEALAAQRLTARPYSLSALQQFADCPYRFLLSAIHRLEPFESPQPLQRLDPLTKGSLVHRIQAEFFRALQSDGELPLRADHRDRILQALEAVLERVAAEVADDVAPAIDRVWRDEIETIRSDLREWITRLLASGDDWDPEFFEFGFGLATSSAAAAPGHERRDPRSQPDPVAIEGRFLLRGSVDLIERKRGTRDRRVTDHKTGKDRSTVDMVVGGGRVLQPVLYSMAVERALGDPVLAGRLSFCTAAGGFGVCDVPLNDRTRAAAVEVLEIIDRAIDTGFLAAAPREGACAWCDFHVVCGPSEERRVARKQQVRLGDLLHLREKP